MLMFTGEMIGYPKDILGKTDEKVMGETHIATGKVLPRTGPGIIRIYTRLREEITRDIMPLASPLIHSRTSVAEVSSASSLQVLRRLGSVFTLVYAAVQKMKKDSWLELQFSLADNFKLNVVYLLDKS
ncbi:hypothetical protein Tco_0952960 [Tanacetum coccineum]|uniref:Uncharacterized protein n=1 Tax=Tanacetum coccineum TaxID=301880 RepID=A0ABQ5DYT2_9ASTR